MKPKTTALNPAALKSFVWIIGFSLLTALGAWLELWLPFTIVPITLQSLFVLLAGAFLGSRRGALSQILYLSYGITGLPVYSGGAFGFFHIFGPTGGYLLAFPVAAFVTGLLVNSRRHWTLNALGFSAGSAVILLGGTFQLTLFTGHDFLRALALGFVPFAAGDFIKSVAAALIFKAKYFFKQF